MCDHSKKCKSIQQAREVEWKKELTQNYVSLSPLEYKASKRLIQTLSAHKQSLKDQEPRDLNSIPCVNN